MSKRQKLSGSAYHKLKASIESEERKCASSLHVFLQKKYVANTKCKDKNAEELWRKEQGENRKIEGDNNDVLKEESFSACGKYRCKYDEGTDEVTAYKKKRKQAITEIAVHADIVFLPRICSGSLLVDLVTLGPKTFQNNDEPFAQTVRPGK